MFDYSIITLGNLCGKEIIPPQILLIIVFCLGYIVTNFYLYQSTPNEEESSKSEKIKLSEQYLDMHNTDNEAFFFGAN